ncbi:MAG: MmcQ/YjbR family DNA-binding protein [Ferruginibacter sp.]
MVDIATFKTLAMSFPETVELPHFEKTSFRINSKIFATLDMANQIACLKLTEIEQSVFCAIDTTMIYPVNNKWGKQGWTFIDLKKVKKTILKDALSKAYLAVTPSKITTKKII